MTIKETLRNYIIQQPDGTRLRVKILRREVFKNQYTKGSIARALAHLKDEGLIELQIAGRNSEWKVIHNFSTSKNK